MQRLGGAVIHMQQILEKVDFLTGSELSVETMQTVKALPIFDEMIVEFLDELSKRLRKDRRAKSYADVMAYAFWIRKASLERLRKKYELEDMRLGRGIVFHIAPSNVPINFAVSLTYALLSGNASIIRVSDKKFEQIELVCEIMEDLIQTEFEILKPYICVVQYPHDEEVTKYFSSICDVRVIWGGDQTIHMIRRAELQPRAVELCFADRDSLAVINADEYLKGDRTKITDAFYQDTYYVDQNACSSPRMVVWIGDKIEEAAEDFWALIDEKVQKEYELKPISGIDKLLNACLISADRENVKIIQENNYVVRARLTKLDDHIMQLKGNCGYFFEYYAKQLEEIIPVLGKSCQTLSYYGIDSLELKELILKHGVRGVDRIVPLGDTLALSTVWDGFDMILSMSRVVGVLSDGN